MTLATDRAAYVRMFSAPHNAARVVQCACGRSSSWREIAQLARLGWVFELRNARLRWTCPDCRKESCQ